MYTQVIEFSQALTESPPSPQLWAGLFHSLVLEICQEDNLTQRRKDAKKNKLFRAEDTKIFCPNCGFALNFYLFDPCNFKPFRERNSPAIMGEQEFSKSPRLEGFRGQNRRKRRQIGLVCTL